MSFFEHTKEELRRSPLTVVATIVGVVVSTLALIVGYLQYAGPPAIVSTATVVQSQQLHLSNLLFVLAFFLAASLSLSSAIRMLARVHWFGALFGSVLSAVLAGFGTMVMLMFSPPKALTPERVTDAENLVFWGVTIIFVAVNGLPVVRDLATPVQRNTDRPNDGMDGLGVLGLAVIILRAWSGFVAAGISKLVRLFLS